MTILKRRDKLTELTTPEMDGNWDFIEGEFDRVGNYTADSGIERTVSSKLSDVISVKDYGATGDGTTDDTAAIQLALDTIVSGSLYFPAGNYKITSSLNLPNKAITLYGDGQASRIFGDVDLIVYPYILNEIYQDIDNLFFDQTGEAISIKLHRIWGAANKSGPSITNCSFKNSKGSVSINAKCISISGITQAQITNNYFLGQGIGGHPTTGIGGYGIFITFTDNMNSSVMNLNISNNKFWTLSKPIWIEDRVIPTGGRLEGVSILSNSFVAGDTAIRLSQSLASLINANIISDYDIAIDIRGDFAFVITGNTELDGATASIRMTVQPTTNVIGGTISGNMIKVNWGGSGILMNNDQAAGRVQTVTITGNTIGKTVAGSPLSGNGITFAGTYEIRNVSINGNTFSNIAIGIQHNGIIGVAQSAFGNTFYTVTNEIVNAPNAFNTITTSNSSSGIIGYKSSSHQFSTNGNLTFSVTPIAGVTDTWIDVYANTSALAKATLRTNSVTAPIVDLEIATKGVGSAVVPASNGVFDIGKNDKRWRNLNTHVIPAGSDTLALRKDIPYVNIVSFGAVGDGTTNNFTAITNAIAEANGRKIFVPKGSSGGNYAITSGTLTLTGVFEYEAGARIFATTPGIIIDNSRFVGFGGGLTNELGEGRYTLGLYSEIRGITTNQSAEAQEVQLNLINIPDDKITYTGSNAKKINGLFVDHRFGGGLARGGRHALAGRLIQNGITTSDNPDRHYVGVVGQVKSSIGDGGTSGNEKGGYFGGNFWADISGSATFVSNITACEFNSSIFTGASSLYRSGIAIAVGGDIRGSLVDTGIAIYNLSDATTTLKNAIRIGPYGGTKNVLGVDSSAITIDQPGSITHGLVINSPMSGQIVNWTDPTGGGSISLGQTNLTINRTNGSIEIGKIGTSNTPFIDFHSGDNVTDFDARISCSGGTSTSGQGALNFTATNIMCAGLLRPLTNNTYDLGANSFRWSKLNTHVIPSGTDTLALVSNLGMKSVKDFGAKGDGSTNDTVAIQAALNSSYQHIYFPPGTYQIDGKLTHTGKPITLSGAGANNTILKWFSTGNESTNPKGFEFTQGNNAYTITVRDMGLYTSSSGTSGVAITVNSNGITPPNRYIRCDFSGLEFSGTTSVVTDGWYGAISLLNSSEVRIDNCAFAGRYAGAFTNKYSEFFVKARWETINPPPSLIYVTRCSVYHVNKGIDSDWVEGIFVHHCNFVAVNYGLYISNTGGTKPQVNFTDSHVNAHVTCVYLHNVNQSTIANNNFYMRTDLGDSLGIYSDSLYMSNISGNKFVSIGTAFATTAIQLTTSSSSYNNIDNNVFQSSTTGVLLDTGSQYITLAPSNTFGNVTNQVVDNGTNNWKFRFFSNRLEYQGTQVLTGRQTGWGATMTGTADKTTVLDVTTATTAQLAARVKALEDAIRTHGLIGS